MHFLKKTNKQDLPPCHSLQETAIRRKICFQQLLVLQLVQPAASLLCQRARGRRWARWSLFSWQPKWLCQSPETEPRNQWLFPVQSWSSMKSWPGQSHDWSARPPGRSICRWLLRPICHLQLKSYVTIFWLLKKSTVYKKCLSTSFIDRRLWM